MADRKMEYSTMVEFMLNMNNAMDSYSKKEYENALHNALTALDNAVNVYLAIVNDYPYNERQFEFARELKRMIDKEQFNVQMDFENKKTAENE